MVRVTYGRRVVMCHILRVRIATAGMCVVFKGRRVDSGSTPASLLRASAMESV